MRARGNCTRWKFPAPKRQAGISLLELSIVLVITGIVLAGLISGVDAQLEQRDRRQTRQQLEEIKQALLGFAVANRRLPCPDLDADGQENACPAAPGIAVGNLPFVTLGVSPTDTWNHAFAYGVAIEFADGIYNASCPAPPPPPPPPAGASFDLCFRGTAPLVNTFQITTAPSGVPPVVAQNIPAVVISYGRNGGLAPTTPDETENQNGDNNVVDKAYSSNPAQPFDDLVEFISANELMYIMLAGGVFR